MSVKTKGLFPVLLALGAFLGAVSPSASLGDTAIWTPTAANLSTFGVSTAFINATGQRITLPRASRHYSPFVGATAVNLTSVGTPFGRDAATADFDGDGDLDVAIANQAGMPEIHYYNATSGSFITNEVTDSAFNSQAIS
ncbi:VCBS repeat-containing protein, partial [bacterium]